MRATDLRVDGVDRPIGVDRGTPWLSWRLESDRPGIRLEGYHVLVATAAELFAADAADVWDSGVIPSGEDVGVAYGGRRLESAHRYWWRIELHLADGERVVSEPSWWEMGLLEPDDWVGSWIVAEDRFSIAERGGGLDWVWHAGERADGAARFRWRFDLPEPRDDLDIMAGAVAQGVSVWLDGVEMARTEATATALGPRPLLSMPIPRIEGGPHILAIEVDPAGAPEVGVSPGVTALLRGRRGTEPLPRLDLRAGTVTRGHGDGDAWVGADFDDASWGPVVATEVEPDLAPPVPAVLIRRRFDAGGAVARARLRVAARGAYEASINGRLVADDVLASESSRFDRRVVYRSHDVTHLLLAGENALGLIVGDGWFASFLVARGRYPWGPAPRSARAQLELEYEDGSSEVIATDRAWAIAPAPIRSSEIYDGETYDARLEQPGWDEPGFDDAAWDRADIADDPGCRLSSQVSPPIRAGESLPPRAISSPAPGTQIVDFGRCIAGRVRIRVRGPEGTRIRLRFAEMLTTDGVLDTSNLRQAKQTDVVILRGDPDGEEFEPRFTYHGFRYVEVTGWPGVPDPASFEAVEIHSDLRPTGDLRIGEPLADWIWAAGTQAQRSNIVGIVTDVPDRDERLGWLGDLSRSWDAISFGRDVHAFTHRVMQNASDSRGTNGAYPAVAPNRSVGDVVRSPGWSDAPIVVAWLAWERYGDPTAITENWDDMAGYLDPIVATNPDLVWRNDLQGFGDWLAVDDRRIFDTSTPNEIYATAYWAYCAGLLGEMAAAVGRDAEAGRYRELHHAIASAFAREFVGADGRVGNGSQTAYAIALRFGLVPAGLRRDAGAHLAADIAARGGALSTGYIGTAFLLDALADTGHRTLAVDLLLRREYPSWGHMIDNGATSLWESWHGDVWSGADEGRGLMPASRNHHALSAVLGFMSRRIGGIAPVRPGYRVIEVHPIWDPRLSPVRARYDSVRGPVGVHWSRAGDRVRLELAVPPTSSARVHLPTANPARILESGTPVHHHPRCAVLSTGDDETIVEVGSGEYRFAID